MRTKPRPGAHVVATLVSTLASLAAACATLTPEQQAAVAKVEVITADPAENCQNLGLVSGSRDSAGPGGVRAKAVLLGANTVRVDAHGATTAFYCPPGAEPTP